MALVRSGGNDALRCSGGFQGFLASIFFLFICIFLFPCFRELFMCAFFNLGFRFFFSNFFCGEAMEEDHDGVVRGTAASLGEVEVHPCRAHIPGA